MSDSEAIWNVVLQVDTLQRTAPIVSDTPVALLPVVPRPAAYADPCAPPPAPPPKPRIAPWLRSEPYLLTKRSVAARMYQEVELYERNHPAPPSPPRISDRHRERPRQQVVAGPYLKSSPPSRKTPEPRGSPSPPTVAPVPPPAVAAPAPPNGEFVQRTEYPVFEIFASVNQPKAEWVLLGFLDPEGRYTDAVREPPAPKPPAPALPPIRLFPVNEPQHLRSRVPLGSTKRPTGRGWFYG
eukprot:TRINITY_DN15778_c0_g1_i1.p1 TRINITY_DN15778_c0_g1~~TRINITY_DN15778_c0_g1_i1.p1  ORF type:complete len:240 (+),score=38.98 TRINITY_DN15778_c0_g1_i1:428-1147(+)